MDLPPPKDLSHHFSRVTARRNASNIKVFYKYWLMPGMGNLAGGLPNSNYFPFDTLEAKVATPTRFRPSPDPSSYQQVNSATTETTTGSHPSSARLLVPHDSVETDRERKIDLSTALNYGTAQGYPPLFNFVQDFTRNKLHPVIPYKDGPGIILTNGSTDGFSKVIEAFSTAWDDRRDPVSMREGLLCEDFVYGQPIQATRPRGLNIVTVAIDEEGMVADGPGGLADVLARWDLRNGKLPHLMYTVTMGQNPTSGLLSLTRRKQIYAICQRYDILIIEDDPYWYLQYPSANQLSFQARGEPVSYTVAMEQRLNLASRGRESSGSTFLDSLVPSYLTIDTDGRVIRLDTFSKTVAPGCRLGWITAQPVFIERFLRITECFSQQPSGFVQSMVAELILGAASQGATDKNVDGWQTDGWVRWLEGLRGNYERRMNIMSQTLEKGRFIANCDRQRQNAASTIGDDFEVLTKTQIYDFRYPMAGMFLWVHCHFDVHPMIGQYPGARLSQAMWIFLTRYKIMVAPGGIFASSEELKEQVGWQYLRLCFAAVNEDQVESLSQRFVEAMRDFWQIEDADTIDELLREVDQDTVQMQGEEYASGMPVVY